MRKTIYANLCTEVGDSICNNWCIDASEAELPVGRFPAIVDLQLENGNMIELHFLTAEYGSYIYAEPGFYTAATHRLCIFND